MDDITVLIVDDHGIVREGLRTVLEESGITVVGEAVSGAEAIEMANALQPQVILLDIRLPDMDGIRVLSAVKSAHPQIDVVMLTTYGNPQYLARAVQAGAAGYLSKDVDPEHIPNVIRSVVREHHLFDPALLREVLKNTAVGQSPSPPPVAPPPVSDLSDREIEVLRLVAEGFNNEAIATALVISLPTVKTHLRHIFEKLGVSDRTQAAVWAIRNHIV